ARDHERGAGGDAVAQRLVHADVGGVARPQVVGVDDEDPVVGPEAQALRQRVHPGRGYWLAGAAPPAPAGAAGCGVGGTSAPPHRPQRPRPAVRARLWASSNAARYQVLGGNALAMAAPERTWSRLTNSPSPVRCT